MEEIIPAARTLLIHFDPTLTQCHQLSAAIRQLDGQMQAQRTGKVVTIPVQYTGDDLAEMAEYPVSYTHLVGYLAVRNPDGG